MVIGPVNVVCEDVESDREENSHHLRHSHKQDVMDAAEECVQYVVMSVARPVTGRDKSGCSFFTENSTAILKEISCLEGTYGGF